MKKFALWVNTGRRLFREGRLTVESSVRAFLNNQTRQSVRLSCCLPRSGAELSLALAAILRLPRWWYLHDALIVVAKKTSISGCAPCRGSDKLAS